jgi:hypothetical protein
MKTIQNRKLKLFMICSLLVVILMFPTTALAQGSNIKDTINQGEVVDQNTVLYGPSVVMDGTVNGDLVAIGNDVKINGTVNGDLAVIGKNVFLNGPVTGSVYISALFLVVGPQASVERDVYFFGNSIQTQAGSTIKRDLNAIGLESELAGNVDRKVNTLIGPVTLVTKVYNFLVSKGWWPKSLQIGPRSFQDRFGNPAAGIAFGLSSMQNLLRLSGVPAPGTLQNSTAAVQSTQHAYAIDTARLQTWFVSLLRTLISLLLLGLLLVWLVPAHLGLAREQARIKPWRALLYGLLVFVFGWLVALLATILFLALAFFFYWVSLPTLGFFTGAFGLMAVGIALSLFWLSIAYFSKIVVAYLIGSLIFRRFIPSHAQSRVWPLVLGVVVYALLASIPYLGWLIAIIATLVGLGAIWMLATSRRLPEPQTAVETQAENALEPAVMAQPDEAAQPAEAAQTDEITSPEDVPSPADTSGEESPKAED